MAKIYTESLKKNNPIKAGNAEPRPRAHVLQNLLNYSKSLEVKKMPNGERTFWVLN